MRRNRNRCIYIQRNTQKIIQTLRDVKADVCRVYYLGITAHSNMGDMAQYYCISKWIGQNYPNYEKVGIESDTVVDTRFGFLDIFKNVYRSCDIIIFQSGYTTQDLGGNHELMHLWS